MPAEATLEWFGATTYRIRANGLTILHDAWFDRPSGWPKYLTADQAGEVDYIVISHAHFDHLPGAEKVALRTGAIIIANCEAINRLREFGLQEDQLLPVAGGERIPLFTKDIWAKAKRKEIELAPAPPLAPPKPHGKYAAMDVHVWPSLHALMPPLADVPDYFDTGKSYVGPAGPYDCTLDITRNMQYGLFRLHDFIPPDHMDEGLRAVADYFQERKSMPMSHCDGGQLLYNFLLGPDKVLLFNSHLGAYDGILNSITPKPNHVILGFGGRANLNGRPYNGSAAEFLTMEVNLLGQPATVWPCLHDRSIIRPYGVITGPAEEMIAAKTKSQVILPEPKKVYIL
ncbi:beta-lactamase domain protein [Cladophialophora carrionii]|uniref:Beta-lactamase domain protein n=1 Tax=Cladophialophora carrionii TaxID=86049 RepID=A0A1C1CP13_9EURO|nr:beta-lactamase domain protein [Cladophialophora carrionii]